MESPKFAMLLLICCWLYFLNFSSAFLLTPEGKSAPRSARFRHRHLPIEPIPGRNPIVLIPGDGGSRLRANLTGKPEVVHYFCERTTKLPFDLWLNLQQFGPFLIDCWADNMRLEFNTSTGLAQQLAGVRVHIPGFGKTHAVEWLDTSKRSPGRYFAPIVDALTAWGYRRGIDIVGAPYDWRRAPRDLGPYFDKLRALIESVYNANDGRKVIVLAHSMGNPMANYFYHNYVDQAWKDKFLEAHISLAGAWGGAAQIVKLFSSGYNMDYYRVLLPPSRLRKMQRSFLSSAFLFPSPELWAPNETLASTPSQNYSMSNLAQFFADVDYIEGFAQWQSTRQSLVLRAPGIKKVFCIFGNDVETPEQFVWHYNWFFPDYQPSEIRYGNGDGTVNQRSLEVCEQWRQQSAAGDGGPSSVVVNRLNGTDHMAILSDARTLALLRQILVDAAGQKRNKN